MKTHIFSHPTFTHESNGPGISRTTAHYSNAQRPDPPAGLLIYLRSSVPTGKTDPRRGRTYEESISWITESLNERYETWISKYRQGKLLIVNVDEVNFATIQGPRFCDRKIQAEIHGLF